MLVVPSGIVEPSLMMVTLNSVPFGSGGLLVIVMFMPSFSCPVVAAPFAEVK